MGQLTGRMIGNYRIVAKLGEGGMGKVYRAVDVMIEREVALKALRPEIANQEGVVERFRSEAVLLAKLNHPAIAQLYTFFNDGDEFYMVMEYVPGETLENLIRRDGAMPWQHALRYAVQTLEGIGHAHALGVLHRDLKPAKIILTPGGKAKIMDFGIARALGAARMTRDGRVIGTLEYLAPERIQGKPADIRSDLYSVGMVLYEMITGRLPFQTASEYELLMAQVQQTPPRPRDLQIDLPAPVEAALMKSLAKDPMERCPDAVAFADELTSLLPASSISQARIPSALKETRLAEPADELMGTAPVPLPQRISGFPAVMPSLAGKPLAILAGLFLIAGLASAFVVLLFHRTAKPAATAALVHQAAVTPPQPASSPLQYRCRSRSC
jgi:eukaryotic-like serine/threonine-protein kinase